MKISLVVPVFNEQDVIPLFYSAVRTNESLRRMDIEIVFVNDGSRDLTVDVIKDLIKNDSAVTLVNFSRNFGKEPALFAGLEYAKGDAIIPIDVDLQDPIDLIPAMIEKWQSGFDVVLAKREDRSSDSYMKRQSAGWFYKLYNKASRPAIEENVGDFRLMSRRVVEEVKKLPERNLFMKGVLGWVGFKTEVLTYKRAERAAGETKFNGWKLWNLALEGITSFSTLPLRIWTYMGMFIAMISLVYALWRTIEKIFWGNPVPGYPSLFVAILFLGGVQLIGIGVLGEYIGRIYIETKQRPRYIVQEVVTREQT